MATARAFYLEISAVYVPKQSRRGREPTFCCLATKFFSTHSRLNGLICNKVLGDWLVLFSFLHVKPHDHLKISECIKSCTHHKTDHFPIRERQPATEHRRWHELWARQTASAFFGGVERETRAQNGSRRSSESREAAISACKYLFFSGWMRRKKRWRKFINQKANRNRYEKIIHEKELFIMVYLIRRPGQRDNRLGVSASRRDNAEKNRGMLVVRDRTAGCDLIWIRVDVLFIRMWY